MPEFALHETLAADTVEAARWPLCHVLLMNDSRYGLTASLWTADRDAAHRLGDALQTGTVFMNRRDYLDPALCWTGCKDTGQGAGLSELGYQALTRPKSYHLKKA